jgi:hypothetical protein
MSNIVLDKLTVADTEQAIAEIWSFAERYRLPSPKLSISFGDGDGRLSMRVTFEESGVAATMIGGALAASLYDWAENSVVPSGELWNGFGTNAQDIDSIGLMTRTCSATMVKSS